MIRYTLLLFLSIVCTTTGFSQTAKIEYIAHAAFVLESQEGTRVLIDPYHSYNQMGYTFPENIEVDFVLITHPHYDHDASTYVSENTPVFREAGNYQFKDIKFRGIGSKHGFYEQITASGNQGYNTIWIVEIGGKQIAHLGDNEIPTAEEVEKLAAVDFIIGPTRDEVLTLFPDKTYIPNHYLLPEITKHTNWMQPIDGWLEGKAQVVQLTSNVFSLDQPNQAGILRLQPSSLVQEWSPAYYEALGYMQEGFTLAREPEKVGEGIALIDKAIAAVPHIFQPYLNKAILLDSQQQYDKVIKVLEEGLTSATDIDWGREARAHQLLADAYLTLEQKDKAYNHCLWIVRHKRIVNKNALEAAEAFLNNYKTN